MPLNPLHHSLVSLNLNTFFKFRYLLQDKNMYDVRISAPGQMMPEYGCGDWMWEWVLEIGFLVWASFSDLMEKQKTKKKTLFSMKCIPFAGYLTQRRKSQGNWLFPAGPHPHKHWNQRIAGWEGTLEVRSNHVSLWRYWWHCLALLASESRRGMLGKHWLLDPHLGESDSGGLGRQYF